MHRNSLKSSIQLNWAQRNWLDVYPYWTAQQDWSIFEWYCQANGRVPMSNRMNHITLTRPKHERTITSKCTENPFFRKRDKFCLAPSLLCHWSGPTNAWLWCTHLIVDSWSANKHERLDGTHIYYFTISNSFCGISLFIARICVCIELGLTVMAVWNWCRAHYFSLLTGMYTAFGTK